MKRNRELQIEKAKKKTIARGTFADGHRSSPTWTNLSL